METSYSADEIARFDALAQRWWDPDGPMRPLHRMNPARIGWIHARIRERFGAASVRVLDVGCGAGVAAEALAKRGCRVLGLDPAEEAIAAARRHAAGRDLPVQYLLGGPEALLGEGTRFPVVMALEVIEHVPDPPAFLRTLGRLCEPGGVLFLSTLNRTARAFLAAKLGAEYLLRWLPVGTHDWRRFITPQELAAALRASGFRLTDIAGLGFDPLTGGWRIGRDVAVNYLVMAEFLISRKSN
jgi:2-polyprenyl-6-hydroxyphenyl methylase/3-demethylubiquinone-9 3-methyltransferase